MNRVLLVGVKDGSIAGRLETGLINMGLEFELLSQHDVVSALSQLNNLVFDVVIVDVNCQFSLEDASGPRGGEHFARLLARKRNGATVALLVESSSAHDFESTPELVVVEMSKSDSLEQLLLLFGPESSALSSLQELCFLQDGEVKFVQGSEDVELREDLLDFLALKAKEIGVSMGADGSRCTMRMNRGEESVACVLTSSSSIFARFGPDKNTAIKPYDDKVSRLLNEAGFR